MTERLASNEVASATATIGAFTASLARADLERLVDGKAGVVLTPVRSRAVLNLRAPPGSATVPDTVHENLGLRLPAAAFGTAANADGRVRALWIGPGDWLIVCTEAARAQIEPVLRALLAGAPGALTDVGHGYAVLNLAGPNAVDVLAQGCGLDLHPDVFGAGQCAMTGLAKLRVVIERRARNAGYDVYVARSFAASLWHFVTEASIEFGYRVNAHTLGER
ncbi:MAG: sarcosine oxidase subunit gamma [Proteobacteria bacterium]|nr:sarcosine oxidase subunit gamma [Burkholderiales bacterium]